MIMHFFSNTYMCCTIKVRSIQRIAEIFLTKLNFFNAWLIRIEYLLLISKLAYYTASFADLII